MREGQEFNGWIYLGCRGAGTDDVWYEYQHKPCGTAVEFMQGSVEHVCPKCEPERWAEFQRRDGLRVD